MPHHSRRVRLNGGNGGANGANGGGTPLLAAPDECDRYASINGRDHVKAKLQEEKVRQILTGKGACDFGSP